MTLTLLLTSILWCPGPGVPAPLVADQLDAWRALVLPTEQEQEWRAIGWLPSLWSAVEAARWEPRPILLWAMNGHPLGCT